MGKWGLKNEWLLSFLVFEFTHSPSYTNLVFLQLTTGQTFFKLFKEFKTCLGDYAVLLRQKLPRSSGTNTIGTQQVR